MGFGPNTREMQRCPSRKENQNTIGSYRVGGNTSFATDPVISNFTSDTLVLAGRRSNLEKS
jgi:hypothetical protein